MSNFTTTYENENINTLEKAKFDETVNNKVAVRTKSDGGSVGSSDLDVGGKLARHHEEILDFHYKTLCLLEKIEHHLSIITGEEL